MDGRKRHLCRTFSPRGLSGLGGIVSLVLLFLAVAPCQGAAPSVVATQDVYFDTDVVPLLTKLGCNSGGCHGQGIGPERVQALPARL